MDRLREKVSRLVVARIGSNMVPPRTVDEDAETVAQLLEKYPIGGLVVFNGRWPETTEALRRLQALSDDGLLVMTDMERGVGQQIAGATTFPHLTAFGSLERDEAITAVSGFASISAWEALATGIHVAFAPVADVNRNPRNPIISTRAFGTDPEHVSRLVESYVRAAGKEGLLTTAKHFPGHGNTYEDSHETTPSVSDSLEVISTQDLPPFEAAINAGVDLVMTAHVRYPALDSSGRMATVSAPVVNDLLRNQLGFSGVVITDSLHMAGALDSGTSEGIRAVQMLNAGVDMLLDLQNPEKAIEHVAKLVFDGGLSEERLDQSIQRVDQLRRKLRSRFGSGVFTSLPDVFGPQIVGSGEHHKAASLIAMRSLAIDGDPPPVDESTLVVFIGREGKSEFVEELENEFPSLKSQFLNPDDVQEQHLSAVRSKAANSTNIIVAVVVKPAAWRSFGIPDELTGLVKWLCGQKPTTVTSLGSPLTLDTFEGARARACTYSDVPVSQLALADRLLNRI